MSPLTRSNHTAARIGRWSANHWKTAIVGWLVFVVASVAVGNDGRHEVPEDERHQRRRGPQGGQDHLRGLQGKGGRAGRDRPDPVQDVDADGSRLPGGDQRRDDDARAVPERARSSSRRSPRATATRSPTTATRSWSRSARRATTTTRPRTSRRSRRPSRRRRPGIPASRSRSSAASAREKKLDAKFNSMLAKVGLLALPAALIILLLVFGSAVAAIAPLLLALTAVMATTGLVSLPSQLIPVDSADLGGHPADRARGRDRLLAVLPPARTRRAGRRSQRGCRTRGCRRDVRPGSAHLRHHRDDRDGRHVPLRRQDVHVLLRRHDDGRRGRDDRLADRPARAALEAGRQGREGPHPVRAPAPQQERREPRLGGDPRPRPAPPGRLGGRRRCDPGRARRPGIQRSRRRPRPRRRSTSPRSLRSSTSRRRSAAATTRPASRSRPPTSPPRPSGPRSPT